MLPGETALKAVASLPQHLLAVPITGSCIKPFSHGDSGADLLQSVCLTHARTLQADRSPLQLGHVVVPSSAVSKHCAAP